MFYQEVFGGLEGGARSRFHTSHGNPGSGLDGVNPHPPLLQAPLDPCSDLFLSPEQRRELGCDAVTFSGSTRGQTATTTVSGPRRCSDNHRIQLPQPPWNDREGELILRGWWKPSNDCIPEGKTHAEIQDLCGPAPCVWTREVPSPKQANRRVSLDISDAGFSDQHRNLIECGWFVLLENMDLVAWILCMMTADPNPLVQPAGGDCILGYVANQSLPIDFDDKEGPWRASMNAVPYLNPGWLQPLRVSWKIKVHWGEPWITKALTAWRSNRSSHDCACIAIAALLLHEISHACGRDWIDDAVDRPCSFARILEQSFAYAALQRYAAAHAGSCCEQYREGGWFNPNDVDFGAC